jgi:hypothetical protein
MIGLVGRVYDEPERLHKTYSKACRPARHEAVKNANTSATEDLIHSLVGRFKGKDSLVEALGRERRLDDLIRSRISFGVPG